jgi:hypothetical protein
MLLATPAANLMTENTANQRPGNRAGNIGFTALSDSQRICTRPVIVCSTPAHDNSISSRFASFNFDSPIGWLLIFVTIPQFADLRTAWHAGN